jgi:hypothetical protein
MSVFIHPLLHINICASALLSVTTEVDFDAAHKITGADELKVKRCHDGASFRNKHERSGYGFQLTGNYTGHPQGL